MGRSPGFDYSPDDDGPSLGQNFAIKHNGFVENSLELVASTLACAGDRGFQPHRDSSSWWNIRARRYNRTGWRNSGLLRRSLKGKVGFLPGRNNPGVHW